MKFGVREICDVVLKAKSATKIGNKIFYKGEPVIYFDTLKTSTLEGAATTVYAQGGRGNARLVAWEGERTVTFTMEDALISPEGFMILSGAGLIEATEGKTLKVHVTETIDASATDENGDALVVRTNDGIKVRLANKPYMPVGTADNFAYLMFMKDGEIISEPFIPVHGNIEADAAGYFQVSVEQFIRNVEDTEDGQYAYGLSEKAIPGIGAFDAILVDYYTEKESNVQQIDITPDKFGGNYYLEAATLFRTTDGVDMPAEFIIPNCKIQSNFTFTMASSGDPSTFTFTMDAFPDYTRFDHSKKVLCAIQIVRHDNDAYLLRDQTHHNPLHEDIVID